MKLRIHFILSAALMLPLLLLQSCKEEETTKEYMDGSIIVDHDMPTYVQPGEKYTFKPSGITAPDGTPVAYYFTAPLTGVKDTLKTDGSVYEYVVPDKLGTYNLSCIAYAVQSSDKYYVSSATYTFVMVKDDPVNGSVTNYAPSGDFSKVKIEGRDYYTGKAAGLEWLRSNLCIVKRDASGNEITGRSFKSSPAMQYLFGGYYTWEEAQTICPEGWHLPSEAEWVDLLKSVGAPADLQPMQSSPSGAGKLMVNAYFNGSAMWDYYRGVDIQNVALGAIPVGYAEILGGKYKYSGYMEYAVFWTSDEYEGKGVYRYLFEQFDNVYVGMGDKQSFAASVRCVR